MRDRPLVVFLFALIAVVALVRTSGPTVRASTPLPNTDVEPPLAPAAPAVFVPREVASLEGWVGDGAKHGIAGARVCASLLAGDASDDERASICTTTGDDGRWSFAALPAGRVEVVASARGFLPTRHGHGTTCPWLDVEPSIANGPVDLILERGGVAVEGRVEDPLGRPVAGAQVHALATAWTEHALPDVVASTDAEGRFELWLPEGSLVVSAEAEGYATGDATVVAPTAQAVVRLGWESVIVGRTIDAATRAPIPFALVHASGHEGGGDVTTRADAYGAFRLRGLAAGRYTVDAEAPSRRGRTKSSIVLAPNEVTNEIEIAMDAARQVVGRVSLSPSGVPCDDGSAWLRDREGASVWGVMDRGGWVRFAAVPSGTYEVHLRCDGREQSATGAGLVVGDADLLDVTWTVAEGLGARGVVVDDAGKPVSGVLVSARRESGGGWASATTAKDGGFVLVGLREGSWSLSTSHERFAEAEAKLVVAEGQEPAPLRIQLETGATLRGKVVDEDGRPVAGLEIRVTGSSWRHTVTRDDGSYAILGLPTGSVELSAARASHAVAIVDPKPTTGESPDPVVVTVVAAGETKELDLRVEREAFVVSGVVVDEDGAAVAEAAVVVEREGDGPDAAAIVKHRCDGAIVTDGAGRFVAKDLPKGRYTVRACRRGVGTAFVRHVEPGRSVAIVLAPMATLRGTIVREDGTSPPRALLTIEDLDLGTSRREDVVLEAGRFAFGELPGGRYRLHAASGDTTAKTSVDLIASADVTTRLVLVAQTPPALVEAVDPDPH